MVNSHSDRPQSLVAVQVTTVEPMGKQLPEGGVHLTRTPPEITGAG
jgi:hypothetical protein